MSTIAKILDKKVIFFLYKSRTRSNDNAGFWWARVTQSKRHLDVEFGEHRGCLISYIIFLFSPRASSWFFFVCYYFFFPSKKAFFEFAKKLFLSGLKKDKKKSIISLSESTYAFGKCRILRR